MLAMHVLYKYSVQDSWLSVPACPTAPLDMRSNACVNLHCLFALVFGHKSWRGGRGVRAG